MDWRAWGTLQGHSELHSDYKKDFEHWKLYFKKCKEIAEREKIQQIEKKTALKILDQALWQFSKDKGVG